MSIKEAVLAGIKEYQEVFKEELTELQSKIIVGSPVDTGHFKNSWQLTTFEPTKLEFRMINPVKYGLALWRYKHSLQGWSPNGGDELVAETEQNIKHRFSLVNKQIFRS
jgi:hypothetical protein